MGAAVEAAELMEHFLWVDNEASRGVVQDPVRMTAIADEIADVVGWLASHRQGPAPGQSTPPAATAASTQTLHSNQQ